MVRENSIMRVINTRFGTENCSDMQRFIQTQEGARMAELIERIHRIGYNVITNVSSNRNGWSINFDINLRGTMLELGGDFYMRQSFSYSDAMAVLEDFERRAPIVNLERLQINHRSQNESLERRLGRRYYGLPLASGAEQIHASILQERGATQLRLFQIDPSSGMATTNSQGLNQQD